MDPLFLLLVCCRITCALSDSSDLFRRAGVIYDKICTQPYPSKDMIYKINLCNPVVKIVGAEVADECFDKFINNLDGVMKRHEFICRLSEDDTDILDTATFDCMTEAGVKQNLTEMLRLMEAYEKDAEKTIMQMEEEDISCTENLLGISNEETEDDEMWKRDSYHRVAHPETLLIF